MAANVKTMARTLGGNPALMDSIDTSNVPGMDAAVQQAQ
jgi:hypothetical protein